MVFLSNGIQCLNCINWIVSCVRSFCCSLFTQGLIPKHFLNFLCIKPLIHSCLIVFECYLRCLLPNIKLHISKHHVCDLKCSHLKVHIFAPYSWIINYTKAFYFLNEGSILEKDHIFKRFFIFLSQNFLFQKNKILKFQHS